MSADLVDGHAAVRGLKADGGAAGTEGGVDGVAVDAVLVGVGEVECGAAVGGVGDQVGGVVRGELDADAAVGSAGGEASSLPGGSVEIGLDAAVGGADVDVASEILDVHAAVGGFGLDVAVDAAEFEAAVHGVELAGELARDEELIAHGPIVVAGGAGAVRFDGSAGGDGDFVEHGFGFGLATGVGADTGFEGDVVAVLADDFDAAVHAVDVDATVDEGESGGADFAGLLAIEPLGEGAAVVTVGGAGMGGEVLGGEREGDDEGGAGDECVQAHGAP